MKKFVNLCQSVYYNITTNDRYAEFTPLDTSIPTVPNIPLTHNDAENNLDQINTSSRSFMLPLLPVSPDPALSWQRIDGWLKKHYIGLAEQLGSPATKADLCAFETDLGFQLPADVRASFCMHDGQELGVVGISAIATEISGPGVIFGAILLSLEAAAAEQQVWCNVASLLERCIADYSALSALQKSFGGQSERVIQWLAHQTSVPAGAIQCTYAHPRWLPLATDGGGNNIALDLAPGPAGRWGQIILFGRDFDTKYVVAPSWAAFLEQFADDLENGKHLLLGSASSSVDIIGSDGVVNDNDTEDCALVYVAKNGRPQSYFNVLKRRAQQLHQTVRTVETASENSTYSSSFLPYVISPALSRSASRNVELLTNKTLSEVWSREPDRALEIMGHLAVICAHNLGADDKENDKEFKIY
jgi:cell wall assembly regulator SMI1